MHRDVAELLQCLPDRKFPYRIFDAASGRVLRSVHGEDEGFEEDPLEVYELRETATRSPVSEAEPAQASAPSDRLSPEVEFRHPGESRGPLPGETYAAGVPAVDSGFRRNDEGTPNPASEISDRLPTDISRAIDRAAHAKVAATASATPVEAAAVASQSLPRMTEAPPRSPVWQPAVEAVAVAAPARRLGVGAVLAMLGGGGREKPRALGVASARSVLQTLQAPGRRVRPGSQLRRSVAQTVNLLQGIRPVPTSLPRLSTGELLRRLRVPGGSGLATAEAAVGMVSHRLADVVGEAQSARRDPPAEQSPRGSAAAILRGVLRH